MATGGVKVKDWQENVQRVWSWQARVGLGPVAYSTSIHNYQNDHVSVSNLLERYADYVKTEHGKVMGRKGRSGWYFIGSVYEIRKEALHLNLRR